MTMMTRLVIFVSSMMILATMVSAAELKPVRLRTEYRSDPLGIAAAQPRLTWVLEASDPAARGLRQAAYQILVASSREKLAAEEADLWDSGKVESDETIHIPYGGKPLASGQDAFWKVRVFDGAGTASDWSESARWSTGLLTPGEWKAKWVGYDEPDAQASALAGEEAFVDLKGAKWVWFDEGDPTKEAPKGERFFRLPLTMFDRPVKRAVFAITADNSFKLYVNGKEAGSGGDFHVPRLIDLTKLLKPKANVFAIEATNADGPAGLIGRLKVEYENGDVFTRDIDKGWASAKERQNGWETEAFTGSDWAPAKEIAAAGDQPWGMPAVKRLELPPPPYLRKTFAADKDIRRAMVYATARGLYELYLNGKRIGRDELTPGWTDYRKRINYSTYDVTEQVKSGANALGALLGDGWYAGYFSYQGKRGLYGENPSLLVQLEIEFADGSKQRIVTDESWKAAYGPWREADLLQGSAYDARREIAGWAEANFDDSAWKPVGVVDAPEAKIEPYLGSPTRRQEEIAAKKITEPQPGVYVFDLGQNMVGWVRLKVRGEAAGTKIELRHAEMLNPDGTPYLVALRQARALDQYICKGGDEGFEPVFTFHGFRYVEVRGLTQKPSLDMITGVVVNADMERSGQIETSNTNVNQLFHNIIWGQKGNYLEVPTDCPQRDERLGWTGDAQFFIRTGAYNFDVGAFFTKWLVDLVQDAQHEDGTFHDVAPDLLGGHGNVAWGDAGIICPYMIYRMYGDRRVIEQHYDAMARYIAFLEKDNKAYIRGVGAYGDWLNLNDATKPEVIGTAYFEHVTRLMSEMAQAIGKDADAKKYQELSDAVRAAFVKNFVNEDGSITESGQTGYALAFTMDLLPADKRAAAAEHFAKAIEKKNNHLATGFIGTPRLLPGLTRAGKPDLAYKLFLTESYPSWLFQVTLGATTMWERWDGWTPEKGFQDPGMNSFNHYAFGSVGEWMYRTMGGIETEGVGFKKIILRPMPGEGLTFAKARYDSIRGTIASEWKREGEGLTVKFIVPPNTTATAYLPAKDAASVTESGKPVAESAGVKFMNAENGQAAYRLESGTYTFSIAQ